MAGPQVRGIWGLGETLLGSETGFGRPGNKQLAIGSSNVCIAIDLLIFTTISPQRDGVHCVSLKDVDLVGG